MVKYLGGVVKYCVVEGKIVLLLYCGSVYDMILDVLGGVCLICIYVGVVKFKELMKRIIFICVRE